MHLTRFLAVCLGGAAGSGARYLLALWLVRPATSWFPWATWLVNVVGCFVLELVLVLVAGMLPLSPALLLLITTGFLGGFTTYSTFNAETLALFRNGAWRLGSLYLALTLVGCLLAGLLGAA